MDLDDPEGEDTLPSAGKGSTFQILKFKRPGLGSFCSTRILDLESDFRALEKDFAPPATTWPRTLQLQWGH